MIDLHAISTVAPRHDLGLGLLLMLAALVVAQLAIVPRLRSRDPAAARTLLLLGVLGVMAVVATLVLHPRAVYASALAWVAIFAVPGLALCRKRLGDREAAWRVGTGSACLLLAIAVAWWLAVMPR